MRFYILLVFAAAIIAVANPLPCSSLPCFHCPNPGPRIERECPGFCNACATSTITQSPLIGPHAVDGRGNARGGSSYAIRVDQSRLRTLGDENEPSGRTRLTQFQTFPPLHGTRGVPTPPRTRTPPPPQSTPPPPRITPPPPRTSSHKPPTFNEWVPLAQLTITDAQPPVQQPETTPNQRHAYHQGQGRANRRRKPPVASNNRQTGENSDYDLYELISEAKPGSPEDSGWFNSLFTASDNSEAFKTSNEKQNGRNNGRHRRPKLRSGSRGIGGTARASEIGGGARERQRRPPQSTIAKTNPDIRTKMVLPNERFQRCCARQPTIPETCYPLCHFDGLNKQMLLDSYARKTCPDEAGFILLLCATERQDHRKCCAEQGVPELCHPFCAPALGLPNMGPQHLQCLNHMQTIAACFRQHMIDRPRYEIIRH